MRAALRYKWILILIGLGVLTAIIAGRPASAGPALDPNSSAPDGTKALVLLLRHLGAHVTAGRSVPLGAGVAVVLDDQLNTADRNAIGRWVTHGNTLVVADPSSPLAEAPAQRSLFGTIGLQAGEVLSSSSCPVDPIRRAFALQPEGGVLLRPGAGDTGCFGSGGYDFVLARPEGFGTVIVLGGPTLWTNANLGRSGNSILAANLLAPAPGVLTSVVGPSRVGGGRTGLIALIPGRLKELFWQLVAAFVLVVLWKGRRLGRPVKETMPVELPGSELVLATGNLLQEGGHRGPAGEILRRDLARTVRRRFGVPGDAGPEVIADVAATRTGVSEEAILDALRGPAPRSDAELVKLGQTISSVRQEVTGVG